ncbi:hypothetical protein [Sphingomonas morindae]|uniref:Uncharacterized protein n=1 Tax=Sphingomonas morindae TaxID=1541170 RepID=A0ABY4X559_9SPHN|nr:hypothetical protein [Sphingomonas morindae]USI71990.1 hypothetical protein LHA26_11790 [Sphingomonas morindae]
MRRPAALCFAFAPRATVARARRPARADRKTGEGRRAEAPVGAASTPARPRGGAKILAFAPARG